MNAPAKSIFIASACAVLGGCVTVPADPGYYEPAPAVYVPAPVYYGPRFYYGPPVYYGPSIHFEFRGDRRRHRHR
jgi:hypothetical protein